MFFIPSLLLPLLLVLRTVPLHYDTSSLPTRARTALDTYFLKYLPACHNLLPVILTSPTHCRHLTEGMGRNFRVLLMHLDFLCCHLQLQPLKQEIIGIARLQYSFIVLKVCAIYLNTYLVLMHGLSFNTCNLASEATNNWHVTMACDQKHECFMTENVAWS